MVKPSRPEKKSQRQQQISILKVISTLNKCVLLWKNLVIGDIIIITINSENFHFIQG